MFSTSLAQVTIGRAGGLVCHVFSNIAYRYTDCARRLRAREANIQIATSHSQSLFLSTYSINI
jgi:hypothetical protein